MHVKQQGGPHRPSSQHQPVDFRCKRIQAEADEKRKLIAQSQQPQIPQVQPTTPVAKLGNLIDKPKQPTMGDLVAEQAGHKSILDIMAERKQ